MGLYYFEWLHQRYLNAVGKLYCAYGVHAVGAVNFTKSHKREHLDYFSDVVG